MNSLLKGAGTIAGHRFKRFALGGSWVWFLLPLVIIYVLGISMQGLFANEFTPPEPYRVAVAGDGARAAAALKTLGSRPELFAVVRVADEEEARAAVLAKKSDAAVIVPPDGQGEPIRVAAAPGAVVGEVIGGALRSSLGDGEPGQAGEPVPAGSDHQAPSWSAASSFGYYAVGITVMFLMYVAHAAMIYSAKDRSSGAYARMRTLGVSHAAFLVAGYVASFGVGAAFVLVMAAATRLLFGVAWGDPLAWAAVTVAGAAGAASISFLIAAAMPSNPKGVDNAGSTLFTIVAMLGGSTVPLSVLPEWFESSFGWLPNRKALDAYFTVAAGGGLADAAGDVGYLLVVALLFVIAGIGVAGLRAKREA